MFDQIFTRNSAVLRHTQAPLYAERLRYLQHLQSQGAARATLARHAWLLLRIAETLCVGTRTSVTLSQIRSAAARWARRPCGRRPGWKHGRGAQQCYMSVARGWLEFLGRIKTKEFKQPYHRELQAFADHMRMQRNLSPSTIHVRCGAVAEFFRWIHSHDISLKRVEPRDIDRLLVYKARRHCLTRRSIQTYAYHLRSFLRYAEEHRWCAQGMATALEVAQVYQAESLPSGPSWESVARLLAQMKGPRSGQIRDRAIILLFSLYGLRVSELRRLTLDDIDWQHALIRVHRSKQSPHVQHYPLTDTARCALVDYLMKGRPKSPRREVFLQLRSPYQPIGSSALWQVVSRRLRPLGLPLKHHGPHSLRHACATRLLERGMNMKAIGDFLGHRHVASTSVYAKVDIKGLRRVAKFDLGRFL